jgi:hypothetical protein
MAEIEGMEKVEGTLLQGADGSMYFISQEELAAFKLPEDHVASVDDAEVSGYDFNTFANIQAFDQFTAYRPPVASASSTTVVPAFVGRWSPRS